MRDNGWLEKQLQYLLKKNFADVVISNPLEIKFGREAKYRFGSIRLVKPRGLRGLRRLRGFGEKIPQKSMITITSLFAKESKSIVMHNGQPTSSTLAYLFPMLPDSSYINS